MNLQELLDDLAVSTLQDLFLSEEGVEITEKDEAFVVAGINEGLRRIYKKLQYVRKSLVIVQNEDISHYPLEAKYSMSNPGIGVTDPFILDNPANPYTGDFLNILSIETLRGNLMKLNDPSARQPVLVVDHNVLHIPKRLHGAGLRVNYAAKHPELSIRKKESEIHLPDELLDALKDFVGYYVFRARASETFQATAMTLLQSYNNQLGDTLLDNTLSTSGFRDRNTIERNGWV